MADLTRGLIPLDTSPLMQVFAMKEQQRIRQEDLARQKKIDAMNAETTALQQRKLRMELEAMANNNPEVLQGLVSDAVSIGSTAEAVLGGIESGVANNGPLVSDLAKKVQSAQGRYTGTRWEETFNALPQLVKRGDWETLTTTLDGLMGEVGVAKSYAGELQALRELRDARSSVSSGADFSNAGYYKAPGSDKWDAVFPTDNGFVNTRGQGVDVDPAGEYMDNIGLNAGSIEDLPSGDWGRFLDKAVAAKNFNDTAFELVGILNDESVSDANTLAGGLARLTNNLRAESRAIGDLFGVSPEEGTTLDELLDPDKYDSNFREMGIVSGELKSIFTSLAYQAAAANGESSRISDRDITRFLTQVGSDASDPKAIKRIVLRTAEDVSRGVSNERQIKFPNREFNNDLGLPRLRSAVDGQTVGGQNGLTNEQSDPFSSMSDEEVLKINPATLNLQQTIEFQERLNRILGQ